MRARKVPMCHKSFLDLVRSHMGWIHRLSHREIWAFQKVTVKVILWGKCFFLLQGIPWIWSTYLPKYTTSHPAWPYSSYSLLRENQVLNLEDVLVTAISRNPVSICRPAFVETDNYVFYALNELSSDCARFSVSCSVYQWVRNTFLSILCSLTVA